MSLYEILGVSEDSSTTEIRRAYLTKAAKLYRTINTDVDDEDHFQTLSRAYQILSLKQYRDAYRRGGEKAISHVDYGDAVHLYEALRSNTTQDPPIVTEFTCSLEELYDGVKKYFEISRTITDDNETYNSEIQRVEVDIERGWKDGTKVTFPGEGHIRPGVTPGDVIFILREEVHPFFVRKKNDLLFEAQITLRQALNGVNILIPHLNGEEIEIIVNKVIYPRYVHRVKGFGMPISGGEGFGDLVIGFAIAFPEYLDNDQREAIQDALDESKIVWREPEL